MKLEIDLVGRGSALVKFSDHDVEETLYITFFSDAFTDLIMLVNALLRGATQSACSFEDDQGQYRLVVARVNDNIMLRVFQFDKTFSFADVSKGELIFEGECELVVFAGQVKWEMEKLLYKHGAKELETLTWRYRFPSEYYDELTHLLMRS